MRGIVFVAVLASCASSFAAEWFVNGDFGDDRNNGLTPIVEGTKNGPFLTIGRALISADKADRVILIPGERPFARVWRCKAAATAAWSACRLKLSERRRAGRFAAVEDEAWNMSGRCLSLHADQAGLSNVLLGRIARGTPTFRSGGFRPLKPGMGWRRDNCISARRKIVCRSRICRGAAVIKRASRCMKSVTSRSRT